MRMITGLVIGLQFLISLQCLYAEDQQKKNLIITKPVRCFKGGHSRSIAGVAFSPDGKLLVSVGDVAQIWELSTGKKRMTIEGSDVGFFDVKFAPDGKSLALPGFYGDIRLWNLETNKLQGLLKDHEGRIFSVDFSPDGKLLASGGGPDYKPGEMRVWKLATMESVLELDKEHSSYVNSVVFSPDGKKLASASEDLVSLWNVDTGLLSNTFHAEKTRDKHLSIFTVAFSPDGRLLASGDSHPAINVWDLKNGSLKYRLLGHADNITSIKFSPDGKFLASAGSYDNSARVWDLSSGKLAVTYKTPEEDLDCIGFSPDGKLLATGGGKIGNPGIVCLWKIPDQ